MRHFKLVCRLVGKSAFAVAEESTHCPFLQTGIISRLAAVNRDPVHWEADSRDPTQWTAQQHGGAVERRSRNPKPKLAHEAH